MYSNGSTKVRRNCKWTQRPQILAAASSSSTFLLAASASAAVSSSALSTGAFWLFALSSHFLTPGSSHSSTAWACTANETCCCRCLSHFRFWKHDMPRLERGVQLYSVRLQKSLDFRSPWTSWMSPLHFATLAGRSICPSNFVSLTDPWSTYCENRKNTKSLQANMKQWWSSVAAGIHHVAVSGLGRVFSMWSNSVFSMFSCCGLAVCSPCSRAVV